MPALLCETHWNDQVEALIHLILLMFSSADVSDQRHLGLVEEVEERDQNVGTLSESTHWGSNIGLL